jgi:hypothetical protein
MDLIKLDIPASFVEAKLDLSWRDVRFGIENGLLAAATAISLAIAACDREASPSAVLLELAGAQNSDPLESLVERLSEMEPPASPDATRKKWLYLTLAWLYEHRDEYDAPLEVVEQVYADFGYPEEIVGFIRYMPMREPDLGTREANEERLLSNWAQYLEATRAVLAKAASLSKKRV